VSADSYVAPQHHFWW